MSKFHINKKGVAAPCTATVRACRFGGDDEHYPNLEAAQKVAEKQLKEDNGGSFSAPVKKASKKAEKVDEVETVDEIEKTVKRAKTRKTENLVDNPRKLEEMIDALDDEDTMGNSEPLIDGAYVTSSSGWEEEDTVLSDADVAILSDEEILSGFETDDDDDFDYNNDSNTNW